MLIRLPRQAPYKLATPESTDSANEYCAICASIQLAAGSLLPKALQLPTFFAVRTIEHAGYIALAIPAPRANPISASRSSARLISCRADQVLGAAFANARFYFRSRTR